jgi:hypothetical protein
LTDELNGRLGDIGFRLAGFYIGQGPFVIGLGNKLEAENTIFSWKEGK